MSNLTEDQIKFIEECKLEFSDRFTDADLDFKKVFEEGISPPPILYPWYTRSRHNRDRAGGSRYQDQGNRNYSQDRDNRNYNSGRNYNNHYDRRHRPY